MVLADNTIPSKSSINIKLLKNLTDNYLLFNEKLYLNSPMTTYIKIYYKDMVEYCDGVAKLPRPCPAPHECASRPAPNFTVLLLSIQMILIH